MGAERRGGYFSRASFLRESGGRIGSLLLHHAGRFRGTLALAFRKGFVALLDFCIHLRRSAQARQRGRNTKFRRTIIGGVKPVA